MHADSRECERSVRAKLKVRRSRKVSPEAILDTVRRCEPDQAPTRIEGSVGNTGAIPGLTEELERITPEIVLARRPGGDGEPREIKREVEADDGGLVLEAVLPDELFDKISPGQELQRGARTGRDVGAVVLGDRGENLEARWVPLGKVVSVEDAFFHAVHARAQVPTIDVVPPAPEVEPL